MSYRVVILKSKATSLKGAEQFLRNRQWQIISTTNLREAIAAVIQKQPEFIMIAADHSNRKVRMLPKLMGQAFPVKVIGFVESSTNSSMAVLHEMGLEYNVFPPVSGPAIERTILKLKKDEERREAEKQKAIADGTYMNEINGPTVVSGEGLSSARDMLTKLAGSDDDHSSDPTVSGPGHTTGNESGIWQKGAGMGDSHSADQDSTDTSHAGSQGSAAGYVPGSAPGSDSGHGGSGIGYMPQQQTPGADGHSNNFIPNSNHPNGHHGTNGSNHPNASQSGQDGEAGGFHNPYNSSWSTDENGNPLPSHGQRRPQQVPGSPGYTGDMDGPPQPGQPGHDNEGPIDSSKGSASTRNKKDAPIMEHDAVDLRKTRQVPTYIQDPTQYPDNSSLIVKGAQTALDESVHVANPLSEFNEIKIATNVACITINSPRFSGYLVAALGADRKIDEDFMTTVKERLFSFLRANGEIIKDDEGMSLKLEEVEFEEWAISQADFLRKSVHGNDEIAMAFFPSKETSVKLEQSVSQKMLQMNLEELKDDTVVEFDLYIYLPSNQKYLLYTPQGKKLGGNQRGRLREKGVTHMHLRKESAGQVKRYRAQTYLNDMISQYKKKPKVKISG